MHIPRAIAQRRIWLRVGTLLDGISTQPLRDAHLVYDQHGILSVGGGVPARDFLSPDQRGPDVHLPDHTLLPGLIEAHAHFFLEGGELDPSKRAEYLRQKPEDLLQLALPRLKKLVRLGIAGVRDAGDKDGVGLALSKLCADRHTLMPYVDSPGAAIHHRGRYGSFMAEPLEDFASAARCVEARVRAGADRIKLIPTGIINFKKGAVTSEPQMTPEEISECTATARSFGRQTLAHASGDAGIERVVEGGVDTVEHGFFVRHDQLAKMRDRQIAWVPTFAPVQKQIDHSRVMGWDAEVVRNLQRILDGHAASLLKACELGVKIIVGSDAGSYGVAHGLGLLDEMELMERAGLSPMAVINSATGVSSGRLACKEKFGRIAPGYLSRFILARNPPLETVANLRKQRTIVFDNAVFETDETFCPSGL